MAIFKNIVIRGASKKLGGIVFYSRQGQTIGRELAPSVANPRTEVQMTQRVKLANVVSAYRANKAWMKGAFEDKEEKESDYNAFVRLNLTTSKVALKKGEAGSGAGVVAPYIVSSGSLEPIQQIVNLNTVRTNIFTGTLELSSSTTVGELSSYILENNNGLREGMQLSLIINLQQINQYSGIPYIVVRYYEMVFDTTSTDLVTKYFPDGILKQLELLGKALYFDGTDIGEGAATFILSETIAGKTKVSAQQLMAYGRNATYYQYTSAQAVQEAIDSYGESEERFLDSKHAKAAKQVYLPVAVDSIIINGTTYFPGDTIPVNFAQGQTIDLVLTQQIDSLVDLTLTDITGPTEIPCSSDLHVDRDKIQIHTQVVHGVASGSTIVGDIVTPDDTISFEFTTAS